MKNSKRILSLLLAVMMVLAIMPVGNTVNAAVIVESDWNTQGIVVTNGDEELTLSGSDASGAYSMTYNVGSDLENYEFNASITDVNKTVKFVDFTFGNVEISLWRSTGRQLQVTVDETKLTDGPTITGTPTAFEITVKVENGKLDCTIVTGGKTYTYQVAQGVTKGDISIGIRNNSSIFEGTDGGEVKFSSISIEDLNGPACEHVYVDGTCTICNEADPNAAYGAMIGETGYETLALALAEAQANDTIVLKKHVSADMVKVPSDITLNLNGHTLTTDILLGFGEVIDQNAAGVDGQGGLVVGSATDTLIHLKETNSYLPIYDSTNGCYKFYGYEFVEKDTGSETIYAVAIRFENLDAYELINESNSGLSLSFDLDLGDGTTFQMPYSDAGIKAWAVEAYTYYSDPTKTRDMTLTMTVTGAPAGAIMTVALGAAFGVSSAV